jgi:large subunit ribosomal protein L29
MKTAEIKEISTKEIQERLDAEKDALVRLKLGHAVSTLDNPMKIRHARRGIAKMITELRRRTLTEQK